MNAFRLKLLALLFMTIDHVGVVLNVLYRYEIAGNEFTHYMTDAYWQMRVIGRLAFPIFAFLIAEGCAHTKNIKKYILRLAVFALISQIPYQVFRGAAVGFAHGLSHYLFHYTSGNVLVTLAFGAVAVYLYQKLFEKRKAKPLYVLGIIFTFIAVAFLSGEYDICGLLIILTVYIFREKDDASPDLKVFGNKYIQVLCCALVALTYYALIMHESIFMISGAVLSALPLLFYNRQSGKRKWKWAFYIYYPAHMLILSAVLYVAVQ